MKNNKNILKILTEIKNKRFRGKEKNLFEIEIEEIKKELDLLTLYSFQDINLNVFNYNKLLEDYKSIRGNKKKHFLFTLELKCLKGLDYIDLITNEKENFESVYKKLKSILVRNEGFIGIYLVDKEIVLLIEDESNSRKVSNVLRSFYKKENYEFAYVFDELTRKISGNNKTLVNSLVNNKNKLKGGRK